MYLSISPGGFGPLRQKGRRGEDTGMGADEETLFQSEGATVTTARAVFGQVTYPIRGITAVEARKVPPAVAPHFVVAAIGATLAVVGGLLAFQAVVQFATAETALAQSTAGAIVAVVLLAIGILMARSQTRAMRAVPWRHAVVLHTAGGQRDALVSDDVDQVAKIVAALGDAIVRQARA
jgi:hypothetical protein